MHQEYDTTLRSRLKNGLICTKNHSVSFMLLFDVSFKSKINFLHTDAKDVSKLIYYYYFFKSHISIKPKKGKRFILFEFLAIC